MKKSLSIVFITLYCTMISVAQVNPQNTAADNTRIATIENQLEVLMVEVPGLGEKVNVNISNTTLNNFLRAVSQVHNINMNLSEELNSISIVNGFNDVTVEDLLLFLVKEYQLDIDFTGTILSIKRFIPPVQVPQEKEINVQYDVTAKTLSTDLRNDPLPKVFRKITEVSGKNLLYTPQLNDKQLSLYLSNVPIDIALQKLAESNAMEMYRTQDGFYEFQAAPGSQDTGGGSVSARRRRNRGEVPYVIVDSINRMVDVDLVNYSIAEVIYGITEDLDLDVFIASPLENAGKVTMKAENIYFDRLLDKMFEGARSSAAVPSPSNDPQQNNRRNNGSGNAQRDGQNSSSFGGNADGGNFTFKKERDVYYFGTENQLTVKTIELVQMMHRSIAMLGDANPSGGFGGGNFGNSNFVSGGTNFYGNGDTSGFNQNGVNNRNQGIGNTGFSRNTSSGTSRGSTEAGSISDIFPATVVEGLDIKIDTELNSFVVSGSGTRVEKFKNFIKYIDKPVPLILIEVMILEVSRTATVDTGVEFGLGKEPVTDEGVAFPSADINLGANTVNKIIGGFNGFGSLNLGNVNPNFYLNIKAMESNGNVKVLSTPKLSTLNGHKAYLSSGQTTYYAVTNQNFFGSQIPQTSQVVNYQPIDAELALEFKPFVSGDGQITLDIQVIQSNFSGVRIAEDAPPDINSRRFSSILRMQANDVAILGGIEEKVKNDSGSGVPLLARIPVIKWLFSKRKREDSKKKLNVIIKPTIFY